MYNLHMYTRIYISFVHKHIYLKHTAHNQVTDIFLEIHYCARACAGVGINICI